MPSARDQSGATLPYPSSGVSTNTYDHTHWRIRDPVRSPIDKLVRARLVVGSVTTSESPVLYVFCHYNKLNLFSFCCYSQRELPTALLHYAHYHHPRDITSGPLPVIIIIITRSLPYSYPSSVRNASLSKVTLTPFASLLLASSPSGPSNLPLPTSSSP